METKTLNEWIRELGYSWVPGKEQLFKGQFTEVEIQSVIASLRTEGAIR